MTLFWRYRLLIGACALGGAILFLCAFALSQIYAAETTVRHYGSFVLRQAYSVGKESSDTLTLLNQKTGEICSDADLTALRKVAFAAEYLKDVGRVSAGRLVCTAIWGRLNEPALLPPPDHIAAETHTALWREKAGILPGGLAVDIAAFEDSAVITAPNAFNAVSDLPAGLGIVVLTRDGSHIFRRFGETKDMGADLAINPGLVNLDRNRFFYSCSPLDICVVARLRLEGFYGAATSKSLGVALAGILTGAWLGLVIAYVDNGRSSIEKRLKRAIREDRLAVLFQPILHHQAKRLVGAEALVRLVDVDGRLISPFHFIELAETLGLSYQITQSVTKKALTEMKPYLQADRRLYVSINVTADDFLQPDFLDFMQKQAARHSVLPEQIALELTERSTASHEHLARRMQEVRQAGFQIFIDDFGTGYSSLSYIANLPISGIKVDQSLVQMATRTDIGMSVVDKIFELAHTLDVKLICEGVERQDEANRLSAAHPELIIQGWLYGKPMPIEKLKAYIHQA
ncbi:EAL domain-containing protein [Martelella alba]|uniref:cyclic-guanylate-specific phosphodiesterase n=1 Tax=Martelella alba TaxID=2590451 RepID=A0A506U714_9HYPH|nr:EAL domain-containing protein [Martelella alba]TPW28864.1 EAL domain-containing protein [Martelella alba]